MQTLDQLPAAPALGLLNKYGVNILAIHAEVKPEQKRKQKIISFIPIVSLFKISIGISFF
jgi:hypothetical protein